MKSTYDYKTLKISASAHKKITDIANKEGLPIKDLIESLGQFYLDSGLSLAELDVSLKGDRFDNLDKKVDKNIERVIKILSKFESTYYAPVFRMTSEVYKNVGYLRDHISIEVASHETESETAKQGIIPDVSLSEDDNELKEKNELLELRLSTAIEILSDIVNKSASSITTSGKVCKLSNEEYQNIKSFIEKCTIQ